MLSVYIAERIRYTTVSSYQLRKNYDHNRHYFGHKAAKDILMLMGDTITAHDIKDKLFEGKAILNIEVNAPNLALLAHEADVLVTQLGLQPRRRARLIADIWQPCMLQVILFGRQVELLLAQGHVEVVMSGCSCLG